MASYTRDELNAISRIASLRKLGREWETGYNASLAPDAEKLKLNWNKATRENLTNFLAGEMGLADFQVTLEGPAQPKPSKVAKPSRSETRRFNAEQVIEIFRLRFDEHLSFNAIAARMADPEQVAAGTNTLGGVYIRNIIERNIYADVALPDQYVEALSVSRNAAAIVKAQRAAKADAAPASTEEVTDEVIEEEDEPEYVEEAFDEDFEDGDDEDELIDDEDDE